MADKITGLKKHWCSYLVLGIISIFFSIILLINYFLSFTSLTVISGLFSLAIGVGGIVTTCRNKKFLPRWILLLVLFIIVSSALLFRPFGILQQNLTTKKEQLKDYQ